jgi:Cu2+-exporting ATPase
MEPVHKQQRHNHHTPEETESTAGQMTHSEHPVIEEHVEEATQQDAREHAHHENHMSHDLHAGHEENAVPHESHTQGSVSGMAESEVHRGDSAAMVQAGESKPTAHSGHEGHVDHTGHEDEFRRRFWISLILSIPVLIFSTQIQEWFLYLPAFPRALSSRLSFQ